MSSAAPCFQALTRPVSWMGLPFSYVVVLALLTFGGFIATLSFVYLIVSGAVGYSALRALAVWDSRFFDVIFTSLSRTPLSVAFFKGREVIYRA